VRVLGGVKGVDEVEMVVPQGAGRVGRLRGGRFEVVQEVVVVFVLVLLSYSVTVWSLVYMGGWNIPRTC
jgi:hypothetical protein